MNGRQMTDLPRHSVSVTGIVLRDDGRVLAIKRHDDGRWVPPGGVLELDETPRGSVISPDSKQTLATASVSAGVRPACPAPPHGPAAGPGCGHRGAACPGGRQLASPRPASSIRLTRSVRSPLPMTQQVTTSTRTARKTSAPSAGRPSPDSRTAGSTPAAALPACFSTAFTALLPAGAAPTAPRAGARPI